MLPGVSIITEEQYFNWKVSTEGAAATPPDFFDFFIKLACLVKHCGVKTFSALEFIPSRSLFLLSAGGLGDFKLGEIGGDNEKGFVLGLAVSVGEGIDGGEGIFFGKVFLTELRLSKLETWLQVG
jgi:hypothetical protein